AAQPRVASNDACRTTTSAARLHGFFKLERLQAEIMRRADVDGLGIGESTRRHHRGRLAGFHMDCGPLSAISPCVILSCSVHSSLVNLTEPTVVVALLCVVSFWLC
ncbi:hypothetical protein GCK32_022123, partial [Trichostrongylus colubriformis]